MFFAFITLIIAISISAVAAYYSIIGLVAIFSSAVLPVAIMGIVLEAGKLITASWLYQNWKRTNFVIKTYLTFAVVVLMFITSMGIFGFLSKAHIDQTLTSDTSNIEIERIESLITIENRRIENAQKNLDNLERLVENLSAEDAAYTRRIQRRERIYRFYDNAWSQIGFSIDGEAGGDEFGFDVSLSSTGQRVVIGGISRWWSCDSL